MLDSEIVQKKEQLRQEWREKLNVHERESAERRGRLEKEKSTVSLSEDSYNSNGISETESRRPVPSKHGW